ncbi:SDR family NAD(P)-dependent oxidoreductase [Agromyces archimandritae]|uniref:Glucose 1-dehydrogenase n=1 Tax=Agromyces archimandritae TaxID=2781962 RepID=A0A975FRM5_9MICO|nr:glucose 1-dehydrogenase [Agromyces archimandritae]QTX05971.1 glucose 1-dehydrogenase [Agromyces archimandritae]
MRLEGKVAIITGAAGGMGKSAALRFAAEGAKVAVVDLQEEAARSAVDEIVAAGGTALAIGADVSNAADVQRIVERTSAELGLPTVLYNNAGVDLENKLPMTETGEDVFDKIIAVNLKGPWLLMKAVVPAMTEAGGGSIINTGSIGAIRAASTAVYCASKGGLLAMTRVAAAELGRFGIRVNGLNPGATMTPMAYQQAEELRARGVEIPDESVASRQFSVLGRFGQPGDIADMALFLASDEASYITGAEFNVDGGMSIMTAVTTHP